VRHISDDDWERQARKFNSGKGMADDRKKKKPFNRDDKKRSFDRDFDRGFNNASRNRYDREDDEDFDNFRPMRDDNPRGGRPSFDNNRGGDRKFDRGGDRDRQPEKKGYNPANSRGPRLPESSATVINPVHMRQRKGWKKNEEDD